MKEIEKIIKKKGLHDATRKLVINIIVAGIILFLLNILLEHLIKHSILSEFLEEYKNWILLSIGIALAWKVLSSFSNTVYEVLIETHGKSTAGAVRSLIKIIGLGIIITFVTGSTTNSATAAALGGFIGMVVGFATQKVLGQVIAGLFLLLARPIKIGDIVDIGGEKKVEVIDFSTLFVIVKRETGEIVYIPNSDVVGKKIVKYLKE